MKFRLYRFHPESGEKPFMQDVDLDIEPAGKMLLDALLAIKAQDETLSLRRSCREGVCGSDALNVNGRNRLACITPLSELKQPIEVRPLPGLPVIRDLIVDMEPFYQTVPLDQALADQRRTRARSRAPAESCRPGAARRRLRVHPVRLLHHVVSVVLVEP
jgi:succinate dehydrogenase/fumarate reductase iron-sulfur protein